MLLNIPYAKSSDRELAKSLGAKWKSDLKMWQLPDSTELPETLKPYLVEVVVATPEAVAFERTTLACQKIEEIASTNKELGRQLAKQMAIRVLMAGGLNIREAREMVGE